MPDSNITKHALSQAFKELIKTQPLKKISVGKICEACGMNRNSFYYHFKDKYELINWIFYTEFIRPMQEDPSPSDWNMLRKFCDYFYQNRTFYQKTLYIEGQNSFSDYLRGFIVSLITDDLADDFPQEPTIEPFAEFYADAFICSIKRWMSRKDCLPPDEFAVFLQKCLVGGSKYVISVQDAREDNLASK